MKKLIKKLRVGGVVIFANSVCPIRAPNETSHASRVKDETTVKTPIH